MRYRITFIMAFMLSFFIGQAQNGGEMSDGYYVVVGVFAIEENADHFSTSLKEQGLPSKHGYSSESKLHYVYLLKSPGYTESKKKADEIRKADTFALAWVKQVGFFSNQSVANPLPLVVTDQPVKSAPVTSDSSKKEEIVVAKKEVKETTPSAPPSLATTEIFLSLFNEANNRVVEGKVQFMDADRVRLISEISGNQYLQLPDPKNSSGNVVLICDAFGYKRIQHTMNYANPVTDSTRVFIEEMPDLLIINFALTRYVKGDIHTLYNVFFYNDAAVMMPSSKFELNELLVMMKENVQCKIVLHGHTNGSYHGKIIKAGPTNNLFSISGDIKEARGSSKELAFARAEVIKTFLVNNGIESSRIEIKSWGGKRPIFDKHSANAKKNVRVEVEVLEN